MKNKKVSRLYHQFAHLLNYPKLSGEQISVALAVCGLVAITAYDKEGQPTHYRETELLKRLPEDKFILTVSEALVLYCQKNNIPFERKPLDAAAEAELLSELSEGSCELFPDCDIKWTY